MIPKNAVFCTHCHTIIVSAHRHDFQTCRCEDREHAITVDGGEEYDRRVFGPKACWQEQGAEKPTLATDLYVCREAGTIGDSAKEQL